MASLTSQSFTRVWNLSTGKFNITDTTNYGALGIALADVTEWFLITGPDGVQFHTGSFGSPDILPAGGLSNNTINLPLDANGEVQEGSYTFVQYINVVGGVLPGTYDLTVTIEFCNEVPTPALSNAIDCFCGSITLTDATAYGTEWIASGRNLQLDNAYPQATGSPYTTAGSSLTVSSSAYTLYVGTWKGSLAVTVTRDYGDHSVTDVITHYENIDFICTDVCDIYCCIKSANTRFTQYKTTYGANSSQAIELERILNRVSVLLTMINQAVNCGKVADATASMLEIKTLINCTDDCSCNDGDEPVAFVPLCGGGGGTSYTFSAAGGLQVTVVGTTITYQLTATNQTILANTYNTEVISTSVLPGEVALTVTDSTDVTTTPDTKTFNVKIPAGVIPDEGDYGNTYSANMLVRWAGGVIVTGANFPRQETNYGTHFQTPTPLAVSGGVITWQSQDAVFELSSFHTADGTNNWKCQPEIVTQTPNGGRSMGSPIAEVAAIVRDANPLNDTVRVRIFDSTTGATMTYGALQNSLTSFVIQFKLHE